MEWGGVGNGYRFSESVYDKLSVALMCVCGELK